MIAASMATLTSQPQAVRPVTALIFQPLPSALSLVGVPVFKALVAGPVINAYPNTTTYQPVAAHHVIAHLSEFEAAPTHVTLSLANVPASAILLVETAQSVLRVITRPTVWIQIHVLSVCVQ